MSAELLHVKNLCVSFRKGQSEHAVVKGVSFTLQPGRCIAIVGESGSGKSVTARSLVGLTGPGAIVRADKLELQGKSLGGLSASTWRIIRGKRIGFILQDALVSLDPLRTVGQEVGEGLKIHGIERSLEQRNARVIDLLELVGLPEPAVMARQLPGELSGGQRQRALIASALSLDPDVLIADEPTTALDVTIQAQILELLQAIRRRGKALILISHDLAVVEKMADEVIVMRHGEVLEQGPATRVFGAPQHDYTRQLLAAIPSAHSRGQRLSTSSPPAFVNHRATDTTSHHSGPLLTVNNMVKRFRGPDGQLRTAVNNVSFQLARGETLGIVGESGSGKSTLARLTLALESADEGEVLLDGRRWSALQERERRSQRKKISVVYQDPLSSFDPRWTVGHILHDSLRAASDGADVSPAQIYELLDLVGLPHSTEERRPLELSGGQRQRIAIARALAPRPRVIVCDEPVSALDVSIQAQILDLLGDLKEKLGMSYLFISHDLGVVHHISDRVLVMNKGEVVEYGDVDDVFLKPKHPYTQKLLSAVPRLSSLEL